MLELEFVTEIEDIYSSQNVHPKCLMHRCCMYKTHILSAQDGILETRLLMKSKAEADFVSCFEIFMLCSGGSAISGVSLLNHIKGRLSNKINGFGF